MRFLAIKLSALQSELKISREIFQEASREADKMFKEKYFPEIPVGSDDVTAQNLATGQEKSEPSGDQDRPEPEKEENRKESPEQEIKKHEALSVDPEVKKLFRRIALKIHPDKLETLDEGFEKNRKNELYSRAIKAMEENDLIVLADIALEIDIDPPEISEQKLKEAENKIIAIKKELAHIESTIVWQWFFCSNKTQKDTILKKLFELMYANKR